MSRDSTTMAGDSSISWGKVGRSTNSSNSLAFMEIRLRSLAKALDEVKTKRVRLEQALRRGHVPESEYASSLLKLIVESNTLSKQKEEIAEKVKVLQNKGLVKR
jgi:seryl-tRNA synthetase